MLFTAELFPEAREEMPTLGTILQGYLMMAEARKELALLSTLL